MAKSKTSKSKRQSKLSTASANDNSTPLQPEDFSVSSPTSDSAPVLMAQAAKPDNPGKPLLKNVISENSLPSVCKLTLHDFSTEGLAETSRLLEGRAKSTWHLAILIPNVGSRENAVRGDTFYNSNRTLNLTPFSGLRSLSIRTNLASNTFAFTLSLLSTLSQRSAPAPGQAPQPPFGGIGLPSLDQVNPIDFLKPPIIVCACDHWTPAEVLSRPGKQERLGQSKKLDGLLFSWVERVLKIIEREDDARNSEETGENVGDGERQNGATTRRRTINDIARGSLIFELTDSSPPPSHKSTTPNSTSISNQFNFQLDNFDFIPQYSLVKLVHLIALSFPKCVSAGMAQIGCLPQSLGKQVLDFDEAKKVGEELGIDVSVFERP